MHLQTYYPEHLNVVPLIKDSAIRNSALSSRELEVLRFIYLNNEQIAERLNKSLYTIKNHIKNIRKKLKLQGSPRSELLAYAIKLYGWEAVMSA